MTIRILHGDCRETLKTLADKSVNTCVTSPPYFGLRDYGNAAQIGLEPTPDEFVAQLVAVFREVRRVLRDDGTLWVNMGDSYTRNPSKGGSGPGGKNIEYSDSYGRAAAAKSGSGSGDGAVRRADQLPIRAAGSGLKDKDLIGVPWLLAFALRADGWYLRSEIIWSKPNPMPESVTDRPTKAHEHIFLLSKAARYFYDAEAIKEPAKDWSTGGPGVGIEDTSERYGAGNGGNSGLAALAAKYKSGGQALTRNKRSVWNVATLAFSGAHFATFPPDLIEPCILAGCPEGGTVLDPFGGAGTTGLVADRHQRSAILCELNEKYIEIAERRITGDAPLFASVGIESEAAP